MFAPSLQKMHWGGSGAFPLRGDSVDKPLCAPGHARISARTLISWTFPSVSHLPSKMVPFALFHEAGKIQRRHSLLVVRREGGGGEREEGERGSKCEGGDEEKKRRRED